MANVIYLQVSKVGMQNNDMTTDVETTVISLNDGKCFTNFVKHLNVQNFLTAEGRKPEVIKVDEVVNGKVVKTGLDVTKYQKQVTDKLNELTDNSPVDYKAKSEKQDDLIAKLTARLDAIDDIKKPSGNREALELKAKELNIDFRATLGDEKLMDRIKEIEPEFEIN